MGSANFADLKPRWGVVYVNRLPENRFGGEPTDMFWLEFICPACGHPFIIALTVGPKIREKAEGPDTRCWAASPMPDGVDWPSRVTISPSIDFTRSGHGRRHPVCTFHGNITNGQVTWS